MTIAELIDDGLALCRILPGEKKPTDGAWTLRPVTDPESFIVNGRECGVGIICGPLSDGVVCVDLDNIDPALADAELPPTQMMDGRPGKERTHRWYRVTSYDGLGSAWPAACLPGPSTAIRKAMDAGQIAPFGRGRYFGDPAGTRDRRVVELKGAGQQANVPPTLHPSGTRRAWDGGKRGQPAETTYVQLLEACMRLAERATSWRRPIARPMFEVPQSIIDATDVHSRQVRAGCYLDAIGPAVAGSGGHSLTWRACCIGGDFGLTAEEFWPSLAAWNASCRPPWDEEELWNKLAEAMECRGSPFGCKLVGPLTAAVLSAQASEGAGHE